MRYFKSLSLGVKLNSIVFIVLAVTLALGLLILNRNATRLMEQTGRQQLKSEATAIQQGLIQTEQGVLANAKLLANSPGLVQAVADGNVNAVRTIVLTTAAANTFDAIEVVDTDGNSLTTFDISEDASQAGMSDSLLSYGLLGVETTGVLTDASGTNLLLGATTPLRDESGTVVGALVASQSLDEKFLDLLARDRDDIHLALFQAGEIKAHTQFEQKIVTSAIDSSLFEQAQNGIIATNDQFLYNSDGIPHIQAVIALGSRRTSADTFIAIYADLNRFYSFQRDVINLATIGVILIGLIVVGIIALFVWRNIVAPLANLQTVAGAMAGGDYQQRFAVTTTDEVGRLGNAFNEMAGAVQHRQNELQELTVSLEQRVQERTAELRERTTRLAKTSHELAIAVKKTEEATRLKSEFLATMSHELRTPLNAIIGYTQILIAGMAGPLNDKQRDFHGRLLLNGKNLLKLIDDILDISKIEAGRLDLIKQPIVLQTWLDQVVAQIKALADNKGLDFQVALDDRLPKVIVGDSDRLKQITLNLLSNAFKFTTEGHVRLELRKQSDNTWTIAVSDTGSGIPAHAQEYIFDEFRQVDGTTQRQHGGTGLGLAIVRNLSLMMAGNVRVQSELGKGSTFTVLLPIVTEEARSSEPLPSTLAQ
ncbi:MAG: HAMP domain-containing protein [Chloroflexi bacterium]|nr:HAMP domain-containing protein [Chloroflexota bacterium]